MNPFYDENYMNYPMYGAGNFMSSSPYMPQRISPFRRLGGNFNLQRTLNMATKTITTVNQVIPLVYQVAPIVNNARNAFRVIKAVNTMNSVDLDEIDRDVVIENTDTEKETETNTSKDEEMFENMV